MEKEVVEKFLGKFIKLEKRTLMPGRNTWKLYGVIEEITGTAVIIFTDRRSAILLEDIVAIEEVQDQRQDNDY